MSEIQRPREDFRAQKEELATKVADMDQENRRVKLEIHGYKMVGELKDENIENVLKEIACLISVKYYASDIHKAH